MRGDLHGFAVLARLVLLNMTGPSPARGYRGHQRHNTAYVEVEGFPQMRTSNIRCKAERRGNCGGTG